MAKRSKSGGPMQQFDNFWSMWAPQLLSVLRIMSGLLILQHGTIKWLGFPPGHQAANTGTLSTMSGFAGILELILGALVVVGLLSRPATFLLSGMCAVAYFWAHAGRSFYPMLNGGELAALYTFVFLYLTAAGPGPWSLDAMMRDKR